MDKVNFNKKEIIIQIIIKAIAIISSIYGIVVTFMGMKSFTYFTILSNIFVIVVLAIFTVKDIKSLKNEKLEKCANTLSIVKFLSVISITLTFLVYLIILAPTNENGIIDSYIGGAAGSLCVHFITPVLAIIDFFISKYEYRIKKVHAVYATIPPIVYVIYVVILSAFGVRWGNMYAPYNFLNFGAKTGWFGFDTSLLGAETLGIGVFYMIVLLLVVFIGIGLLYLFIKEKLGKKFIR